MSRVAWHRPARIPVPQLPADRVNVAAPPQVQTQSNTSSLMTTLLPMLSSISIAAYMITYHNTLLIFLGVGIVTLSVSITFAVRYQFRSSTRKTKDRQLDRYAAYLESIKDTARAVAGSQRAVAVWRWPSPERLWAIAVGRRRVWERRPADPDFLHVRLGTGRGDLVTPLVFGARADPTIEYEPKLMDNVQKLVTTYGSVGKQPVVVDLDGAGVVSLVGPREVTQDVCRALLCQVAVLHSPDDVAVMVSAGGADDAWEWATWLPHTRDPDAGDPAMPSMVASDYGGLADVVDREVGRAQSERAERRSMLRGARHTATAKRTLIVIDGFRPDSAWARAPLARRLVESAGADTGITVVALVEDTSQEPSKVDVRVRLDGDGRLEVEAGDSQLVGTVATGVADRPPVELCEATARALAPLILGEEGEEALEKTVHLADLLGVGDLERFDPTDTWFSPEDDVLRVPIGIESDGGVLDLDLKESAQGGIGPHGLIVGATGSGKSELLRTLLTGLTTRHSPDLLSLVLVDFKGGATFAGVTELPHVAGLITNLADDLALVDRVRDALVGEQQRRQRMLREAGNIDSLRQYQARQAAGGLDTQGRPLEPLPYLLVIVDEFGELLSLRPDFIELFVQIGRVGRSLGIHLLLATQRLEEGRLRGLESHLSYRICLRTFSAAESRAVIGTADAYHLPQLPGSAYLKVGESVYERFRVAHVSAPYADAMVADGAERSSGEPVMLRPREPAVPDDAEVVAAPARPASGAPADERTQMLVLVERLVRFGQPVHQVWLPPLPAAIPLDALLGPIAAEEGRGFQASLRLYEGLRIPVGVMDLPSQQEQRPLVLDFAQQQPHLLIVGASQSGKSTFLRTLMLSAMLTHTPDEVRFYGIDYGGGTLESLSGAPHVAGVAVRGEVDRASRVFNEVRRVIAQREQLFRVIGASSVADVRRMREDGSLTADASAADVFVLIDNWGAVRGEVPDADGYLLDTASRGAGVGVHLVVTANRWGDIRANVRDGIGGRLELRLNDPSESEVNRQIARLVPAGGPGRGVVPPGALYQAVLPRLDGRDTAAGLREAQDEIVGKLSAAWRGERAPAIRLLPDRVTIDEIAPGDLATDEPGVVVGVGETALEPVRLDLSSGDQHCIVIGDGGSGKSVFLRTWMHALVAGHSDAEIRFMVVDYRHALMGVVPGSYIGAYAGDAFAAREYVSQLAGTLAGRLPPPNVSRRELQQRSWWEGPELYLVIDDYDMVAGSPAASPLQPLLDLLPHGREIGLHIVLTRGSSGFARAAMADPVIARIRELGAAGLMLSADPREGTLLGGVRGTDMAPGRGVLVRRRRENELVQILLGDAEAEADEEA